MRRITRMNNPDLPGQTGWRRSELRLPSPQDKLYLVFQGRELRVEVETGVMGHGVSIAIEQDGVWRLVEAYAVERPSDSATTNRDQRSDIFGLAANRAIDYQRRTNNTVPDGEINNRLYFQYWFRECKIEIERGGTRILGNLSIERGGVWDRLMGYGVGELEDVFYPGIEFAARFIWINKIGGGDVRER